MAWTEEERETIFKAFYETGESASVIARRYRVSRNTIIGVAHRKAKSLGLIPGKVAPPRTKTDRPAPSPRHGAPKPRPVRSGFRGKAVKPMPPSVPVLPPLAPPVARNLSLAGLKSNECHFAVTPHHVRPDAHRFCGAPVAHDASYCPFHQKTTHV